MALYWLWLASGVFMILLELVVPGFVICFFGISALVTGVVNCFFPGFPLIGQLLLFSLGGAALALSCRKLAPGIFAGAEKHDGGKDIDCDDVDGEVCICREEISADIPGKVEFRGSLWSAKSDCRISPGEYCVVKARENLTLQVVRK